MAPASPALTGPAPTPADPSGGGSPAVVPPSDVNDPAITQPSGGGGAPAPDGPTPRPPDAVPPGGGGSPATDPVPPPDAVPPGGGGSPATDSVPPATYANPVIPGFHPDPSIVRVGDDYYVVNSTFEYFPGLPIFQSRDLVNWRQIGHALTRPSQLPLVGAASGFGGIYAPSIRYNEGIFYVICTNVNLSGHFIVSTTDPAGEWSELVRIGDNGGGIDPSLFFDDDGRVYYTRTSGAENGGIFQSEINVADGTLVAQPTLIWSGTGGIFPEGPHLYKINGTYYLMIAEGGTGYDHMETIARASSPFGPFEPFAGNPILSHRGLTTEPIQATGHGDLVQTSGGTWWMVFLGIRPPDGAHHHLGRETFLAPVTWDAAGWPIVNGNQPVGLTVSGVGLPPAAPWPVEPPRDDFTATSLGLAWNFVRNPRPTDWSLSARSGFLRLLGTGVSLNDTGSPTFVGRRQEHLSASASTLLDFQPDQPGQEAGLVVRQNEENHYDLAVTLVGAQRRVRFQTRLGGSATVVDERDLPDGPVTLSIEARANEYEFSYTVAGEATVSLGIAPTAALSAETAGGFTGVYFGMYAWAGTGNSQPAADFDWFEYTAN